MKIIAYLIILAIVLVFILFDIKNLSVSTSYFWIDNSYKNIILPVLVTISFFAGILVSSIYSFINFKDTKKRDNAQTKRVEKMSINQDNAQLKIQTLEAKIQTLETALDKILKKGN